MANVLETFLENHGGVDVSTDQFKASMSHGNMRILDNEHLLDAPRRIRENRNFDDVRGFVEYCQDFKQPNSVIFAGNSRVVAELDYHSGAENPKWGDHTASFTLEKSPQWKHWTASNGDWMNQSDFADFLDDGAASVIEPTQADLLDLVRNFRVTAKMETDSNISAGGHTLSFNEEVKGTATKRDIDIPEKLTIVLQPYSGAERINSFIEDEESKVSSYKLQARLFWRYKHGSGRESIQFRYSILNIDKAEDETLENIRAALKASTQIKTYIS